MGTVQSRADKDARTLLIARALVPLVLALAAGGLLLVLADRIGLHARDPAVRVATGVAALVTVGLLLRRR